MPALTTFTNTAAKLTLSSGYLLGLAPGTDKFVTDMKGWAAGAKMRRNSTERLNQPGNFAESGVRDARYPSVSGHYVAPNRRAAQLFVDDLNAYLGDGEAGILEVDDADLGVRWASVYLVGVEVNYAGGRDVGFTVDLEAPDPRKYGAPVTGFTGIATAGGGLQWDMFAAGTAGIMDYGAPGNLGTITLRNEGLAEVFPTYQVDGWAPDFTITEVETGRRLRYAGIIPEGQSLTLDAATGAVLLQGEDRGGNLLVGEWGAIPPRSSRTYLFESPMGLNAKLTMKAVPGWY